jgi:hypothetical protein
VGPAAPTTRHCRQTTHHWLFRLVQPPIPLVSRISRSPMESGGFGRFHSSQSPFESLVQLHFGTDSGYGYGGVHPVSHSPLLLSFCRSSHQIVCKLGRDTYLQLGHHAMISAQKLGRLLNFSPEVLIGGVYPMYFVRTSSKACRCACLLFLDTNYWPVELWQKKEKVTSHLARIVPLGNEMGNETYKYSTSTSTSVSGYNTSTCTSASSLSMSCSGNDVAENSIGHEVHWDRIQDTEYRVQNQALGCQSMLSFPLNAGLLLRPALESMPGAR